MVSSIVQNVSRRLGLIPDLIEKAEAPKPVTASSDDAVMKRLRDLSGLASGWAARVNARRAELEELAPTDLDAVLDLDDSRLAEIANLQTQITLGEAALEKIRGDADALFAAAVHILERLIGKVSALADARVSKVEARARELLASFFPEPVLARAVELLPLVRTERAFAGSMKSRGSSGIPMVMGSHGYAVPAPGTQPATVVRRYDAIQSVIATLEQRADAPIDFDVNFRGMFPDAN